jgi:soluble lytic murein transglycosylase-like protein
VDRSQTARRARLAAGFFVCLLLTCSEAVLAGAQQYEVLSNEVRGALRASIESARPPRTPFDSPAAHLTYLRWLSDTSARLSEKQPNYQLRVELLDTVYYEAKRAGLEPELILGLIQVESNFRKFAVSGAGARGLTQVMPFWSDLIGDGDPSKLFNVHVNIRFGCVILRHYLDIEHGNLYRALGRYNGSTGQPEYPTLVLAAWQKWRATARLPPSPPGEVSGAGASL